jgi:hypothetical protein
VRFEPTYTSLFERLLANSAESEQYAHRGCPCWVWTGRIRSAYPYITIRVPGKQNPQSFRAHRVMAEIVVGRALDPSKETIDHGCEIPWCINYWHFRLATIGDNSRDRHRRDAGKPRIVMPYLIDPKLYLLDPLVRELPRLRSELLQECPF